MKTSWRSASLVATAAALLALTTACGQDQGDQADTGQNVGSAADAQGGYGSSDGYGSSGTTDKSAAKAKSAGQLASWDSEELGKVLTDSDGMTLYRFDKDTAEPPKSNCDAACLKAWPVVPASGAKAAPGVDASLLGEVTAADGTKQLTVDGWPMYHYAMDKKAGDVKGQEWAELGGPRPPTARRPTRRPSRRPGPNPPTSRASPRATTRSSVRSSSTRTG